MVTTPPLTTAAARERAIVSAIRAVPRGAIASYGEIARRAGLPGRARLVGQVLRKTPASKLPWFRITGAGGRIAFPRGSRLFAAQVRHLEREGARVTAGRAVPRVARELSLDAALWRPRD